MRTLAELQEALQLEQTLLRDFEESLKEAQAAAAKDKAYFGEADYGECQQLRKEIGKQRVKVQLLAWVLGSKEQDEQRAAEDAKRRAEAQAAHQHSVDNDLPF